MSYSSGVRATANKVAGGRWFDSSYDSKLKAGTMLIRTVTVLTGSSVRIVIASSGDEYIMVLQKQNGTAPTEFFDSENEPVKMEDKDNNTAIIINDYASSVEQSFDVSDKDTWTDDLGNIYKLIISIGE